MMSGDGKRTSAEAGMDGPGMSDAEFFAMMEQYTKAQDAYFAAASTSASSSPGGIAVSAITDTAHTPRPKKRKSRWGTDDTKTSVPGMPTTLPKGLSGEQERQYIVQLQIEEITRKLRSNEMGIPKNPEDRSPSPE